MGAYLDTPNTEKHSEKGVNNMCAWGATGMQGWRTGMEDTHIASKISLPKDQQGMLFGVFDGHGGAEVAEHTKKHFQRILESQPDFKSGNFVEALKKSFVEYDTLVGKENFAMDTGCTACVVLITPTEIICSNAGDSRGCLSRDKVAVPLSYDHKPGNDEELKRIQEANHFVEDDRVDGNLALSRAFGDFQFKDQKGTQPKNQAVTSFPDVLVFKREKKDEYIVLACDGIWDCVSNEECVKKVGDELKDKNTPDDSLHEIVEGLLDSILAVDTSDGVGTDNMTAIMIKLYNKDL